MTKHTTTLIISVVAAIQLLSPVTARAQDPDIITVGGETGRDFRIVVQRDSSVDSTMYGTISVNGQVLGTTYENRYLMIAAATYFGALRDTSPTSKAGGHVQNPWGGLGRKGDFLLEVVNATADDDGHPKSDILFHGGSKPSESKGCIMLGPVHRTKAGVRYLVNSDPLRQLRLLFYDGQDDPIQTPNKHITIEIRDIPEGSP